MTQEPEQVIAKVDSDSEGEKAKACVDCVYLLGIRHRINDAAEMWRCCHPENVVGWEVDLVTGVKHKKFKLTESIYIARLEHCKGNWWELYVQPQYSPLATICGLEPTELMDEETLRKNRKAANKRIEEIKAKKRKLSSDDINNL